MSTALAHKVKPKKAKSKKSGSSSFVLVKTAKKKNQKKGTKKGEDLFIKKTKKQNKKQENKKKVVTKEQFYGDFKVIKTPKKPSEDKAFKATLKHIKQTKDEQKVHPDPKNKLTQVKEASILTKAEQDKKNDEITHFKTIENTSKEAKEKKFTPQTFKKLLQKDLDNLEDNLPTDESSAEQFKKEKPLDDVKKNVGTNVTNEKEKIAGPLASDAKQTKPPTSNLPTETAKQIPIEKIGKTPKPINKKAATPKPKHKTEISMEKESESIDNYMKENEVTDAQLANSNEPKFTEALGSKTKAQAEAKQAPKTYRKIENVRLGAAQNTAEVEGQKGLHGMFQSKLGNFAGVLNKQQTTEKSDKEQQKEINAKFDEVYIKTKTKVAEKLDSISEKVDLFFEEGQAVDKAKKTFEKNVEKKLGDIYGWTTIDDSIASFFSGKDVNEGAIKKVFVSEKTKFIKTLDGIFDKIATIISNGLNEALKIIDDGRKKTQTIYDGLSKKQKDLAKDALDAFTDKYADLEETVNAKEQELATDLAKKYKENVDSLQETFDTIKERVSATWLEAAFNFVKGVIETIIKIKNLLLNLLAAAVDAIKAIIADPIGFLKNLFLGIKQGFENFFINIKTHLITALVEWLTGSLGGIGITIPKDLFSLKGIFSLVMQILGLTWDYFRNKAVKLLGEPVVSAMEKAVEVFTIIKEKGIHGLWEYIKEQFNDLKTVVMDAIRDMVITKVVEAGIKWIMGLLSPAGAFVKAAMLIIDVVRFFVERAAQIFELVNAFVNGIRALAQGNVQAVAKSIEKALAKVLPVLIGFLAALVGVTGLTGRVQKIIKRIRKRIDKAINKVIKKAKKAFKGLVKKGKVKVKGAVKGLFKWLGIKKKFKDKNNEEHTLFFEGKGKTSKLMMKSVKKQVIKHIFEHKKDKNTRSKAIEAEAAYNQFVAAKSLALKGGKTTQEDKKNAENLISTVNLVSQKLRELPGDFTPADYPTASDVDFNSDSNKPTNVTMNYLTDAVQYGSPPGSGSGVTGWNEVKDILGLTTGQDDGWIQFHLINDHLGGEGNPNNLIPTPNSINKAYQKFENKTHTLIFNTSSRGGNNNDPNQKNVVWMHVKVKYYKKDLNIFAKQVQAKTGIYHYKPKDGKNNLKQKWIKDSKAIFTTTLDIPNPRLMVSGVNLAKSGQQHIKSFFDRKGIEYSNTLINEIVNNRPYTNKSDFTVRLANILINRKIDDNIRRANEIQVRIKIKQILRYFNNKLDTK